MTGRGCGRRAASSQASWGTWQRVMEPAQGHATCAFSGQRAGPGVKRRRRRGRRHQPPSPFKKCEGGVATTCCAAGAAACTFSGGPASRHARPLLGRASGRCGAVAQQRSQCALLCCSGTHSAQWQTVAGGPTRSKCSVPPGSGPFQSAASRLRMNSCTVGVGARSGSQESYGDSAHRCHSAAQHVSRRAARPLLSLQQMQCLPHSSPHRPVSLLASGTPHAACCVTFSAAPPARQAATLGDAHWVSKRGVRHRADAAGRPRVC